MAVSYESLVPVVYSFSVVQTRVERVAAHSRVCGHHSRQCTWHRLAVETGTLLWQTAGVVVWSVHVVLLAVCADVAFPSFANQAQHSARSLAAHATVRAHAGRQRW